MMTSSKSTKISIRLAKYAVIIACVLGFTISLVQLFLDLDGEKKRLDDTIGQVLGISKESAIQAATNLDMELATKVSKGLFHFSPIYRAEIVDNFGDTLSLVERDRPTDSPAWEFVANLILETTKSYSVDLIHPDYNEVMGVMTVEVDIHSFTQGFFNRAIVVILSGLLRNFLLAFILLVLFHFLLTRPLLLVIESFTKITPGESDNSKIAVNHFHRNDELGVLVNTINSLLDRFNNAFARLTQAEEEVRGSEERIRLLLDSSAEAIYGIDLEGRCTFVNNSCLRMLGYNRVNELVGSHMHMIIHNCHLDCTADPAWQSSLHKAFLAKERIHVDEEVLCRADGTSFPAECWSQPISKDNEVTGAVVTFVDISKRLHLEKERMQLENQLQHAQKMESVGRLAGGVAHDFNNILSIILGYSELILIGMENDAPFRKDIELIRDGGEKAAALTRQLLALSRKQVLDVQSFSIDTVINDIAKLLDNLLGDEVQVDIYNNATSGVVEADKGQIEQVLMNLAINAKDAMSGGGRLIVETRDVELDQEYVRTNVDVEPGPYVMVSVRDFGEGMSEDVLEQLFDPFFTTKEMGKGTGLGLSIVHGIIKQHNGHISVYSELGKGTTFKIYLPATDKDAKEDIFDGNFVRPQGSETVLVVDDMQSIRELTIDMIEPWGYKCLEASSGEEALKFASKCPDLLITDVVMPEMSGRELADIFIEKCPSVKVIYMSGYTGDAIVQHGVLEEGIHFIQKPVTSSILLNKMRQVLDS